MNRFSKQRLFCLLLVLSVLFCACNIQNGAVGDSSSISDGSYFSEQPSDDFSSDSGSQSSEGSSNNGFDESYENSNTSSDTSGGSLTGLLEIYFVDVGQGDCVVMMLPSGEVIFVDTGPAGGKGKLQNFLSEKEISIIDYAFFTHPHADHIGNASFIIENFTVKNVYMPDAVTTTKTFENLLTALENSPQTTITSAFSGQVVECGEVKISVLSPKRSGYKELNDYSIVLKITYGATSALLTGDATEYAENDLLTAKDDISATLLKVGHHGSSTSTSALFLKKVAPSYAVIMCGAGNSYGHPHSEVLERLKGSGVQIFRTDTDGTVVFHSDGEVLYPA